MALELLIKISDEIGETVKNLDEVSEKLSDLEDKQDEQTESSEKSNKKQSLGWLGLGLIAGATILGIAKHSAIASLYMNDFSDAFGYLIDEIITPAEPLLQKASDLLWELGDRFEKLPEPIKKVSSGLFLIGGGVGALAAGFAVLKGLGITTLFSGMSSAIMGIPMSLTTAVTAVGAGAVAIGLAVGLAGMKVIDMVGGFDKIGKWADDFATKNPVAKALIDAILDPIATTGVILLDIVRGDWDKIPEHMEYMNEKLKDNLNLIKDTIYNGFTNIFRDTFDSVTNSLADLIISTDTYFNELSDNFKDWATNMVDSFLEGISDLPIKLSNFLRDGIHEHLSWLPEWASGAIGLSPTLIQIGEMVPQSIQEGIESSPLDVNPKVNQSNINKSMIDNINGGGMGNGNGKEVNIEIKPNIHLHDMKVSNDFDISDLANKLSSYWKNDIRRSVG